MATVIDSHHQEIPNNFGCWGYFFVYTCEKRQHHAGVFILVKIISNVVAHTGSKVGFDTVEYRCNQDGANDECNGDNDDAFHVEVS